MTPETQQRVAELIEHYRLAFLPEALTKVELARRLDVDAAYIKRVIKGTQPLSRHLAADITTTLGFSPEDRAYLYEHLSVEDRLIAPYLDGVERRWLNIFQTGLRCSGVLSRVLLTKPNYAPLWALARFYIARFDTNRSIRLLTQAMSSAESDGPSHLLGIIYLDMADAYGLAGDFATNMDFARRSEQLCRGLLENRPTRSAHMAVGRAIVMQQQAEYIQGNEERSWLLHERALPYLSTAGDHYGLCKSFSFLSLFRFWQGNLTDAQYYMEQSYDHARSIKLDHDPWWSIRDGLYLGSHWWHLVAMASRLDIIACKGESASNRFAPLFIKQHHQHAFLSWTRDFPPFSPRYAWIYEQSIMDLKKIDRRFRRWEKELRELNCRNLHADVLLSYGDFLRWSANEPQLARNKYQEARDIAKRNGYELFVRASEARMLANIPPFSGIAQLSM